MRIKHISLFIAFLMLLSVFSSCDISESSKETTVSPAESLESTTEITTGTSEEINTAPNTDVSEPNENNIEVTEPKNQSNEFDPEEEVWAYPDINEAETDLAEVDYSKFIFMSEPVYIDSDKELSIHNYSEAREMLKAAEAHNGEKVCASSYEEAVALLGQVIEGSGDNKYVIMVSVSFEGMFGAFYVHMGYIEMYNMCLNSGEKQDLLFYTAKKLERTSAEAFIRSWEFFTKYSHINSITFYTVPVVNVIK